MSLGAYHRPHPWLPGELNSVLQNSASARCSTHTTRHHKSTTEARVKNSRKAPVLMVNGSDPPARVYIISQVHLFQKVTDLWFCSSSFRKQAKHICYSPVAPNIHQSPLYLLKILTHRGLITSEQDGIHSLCISIKPAQPRIHDGKQK